MLSYDAAPPFSAPLRFFLTAPIFGMLAGLGLLLAGDLALSSRWTPQALALTHLFTLGCLGQVMLGALIQILPVLAGCSLPQPKRFAWLTHLGLTAGALILAGGFWFGSPSSLQAAVGILVPVLLGFVGLTLYALMRAPHADASGKAIRWALLSLLATVLLGGSLGALLGWGLSIPLQATLHLHAAWGLGGWLIGLVGAVAFRVVPMFQLTPPYPPRFERFWAPALQCALCLLTVAMILQAPWLGLISHLLLAAALIALAGMTYRLQRQSRRPQDVTTRFWSMAMLSLLTTVGLGIAELAGLQHPALPVLLGTVLMAGFGLSVISGMLYKIVPFLAWLHLQRAAQRRYAIPNMRQILAEPAMQQQLHSHWIALVLLMAAACGIPVCSWLGGMALCVSQGWLLRNLIIATRLYTVTRQRIALALHQDGLPSRLC
ncbi:permease [Parachitinimonas caeni]|uniref:Permease n=1 Tax=Parachitinimonas caeni TaxID=3031301 RepID=A0ABT7E0B0_9NEIS|nr:permease [Parachitinimonas caeni]MDK2125751.1 permease [Parachitinimonas caeni]